MTHNTPLSPRPRPLHDLADGRRPLMTVAQLRAHGVSAAETNEQCRPGGPWQQLLPNVVLLHPGPPTSEERLHAVLLYAARDRGPGAASAAAPGVSVSVPVQPGGEQPRVPAYAEAMITGLAALTLHGFSSTPPLPSLDLIDVLGRGCACCVRRAARGSYAPRRCRPPWS